MYDRRDFLRATGGAVLGAGLLSGSAGAQYDQFENYSLVGTAPVPGINEVVAQGDWAYATSQGSITTIDINDPTAPFVAGRAEGEDPEDTPDVKVAGDVAALAHNGGVPGISIFDVSDPTDPTFESFYEDKGTVHNCFLKQAPDDQVYAYLCISDSFPTARVVIVDVTDPANPETLEGEDPSYQDGTDVPDGGDGPDERGTGGAWMLKDAQPEMADGGNSPIHDIYVAETDAGNELAYLCFWDSGVVVVDVSVKRHPVAVGHFSGTPDATGDLIDYVTGERTNAHYVQPTPDLGYTFVGAETFPGPAAPPGGDLFQPLRDHGGIRVFDTRAVKPLAEGGRAIYPEVDAGAIAARRANGTAVPEAPFGRRDPYQDPDPDRTKDNRSAPMVAYVPAPEGVDDAALTSHSFDVTDRFLFSSFYQGGIRAYDLTTLYRGGDYEVHARSPSRPIEVGAFAPDGTAFWTAVDVDYEEAPDRTFTMGADIGKGIVMLEFDRRSSSPL